MTNWEIVKEEIRKEYNKIATHPDSTRCERDIMVWAISTVVKRHTNERDRNLFENIDWLTQEVESICDYSDGEKCYEDIVLKDCDGTKEDCFFKETKSGVLDPLYFIKHPEEMRDTTPEEEKTVSDYIESISEPQQKARLIKIAEDFAVNPNHISAIRRNTEDAEITDIWVSGKHFTVDVDYITFCNQFGIEVV